MAKYYVTMTDKFMSGWGMADNKTNKLVIACDTIQEAFVVEGNAKRRGEMKYVNIVTKKPYYNRQSFVTSYHDKSDYEAWFVNQPEWS